MKITVHRQDDFTAGMVKAHCQPRGLAEVATLLDGLELRMRPVLGDQPLQRPVSTAVVDT